MPTKKSSAPKKRALPDDIPEYAVDRETLMTFFRPPIGKSKFYDLQQEGYIVPVEAVSGRYRLNLSLIRLGLKPVKDLPAGEDAKARRERIVRLALWLIAPDLIERPPWLLERDPTDDEQAQAVLTGLFMHPRLETLTTREERQAFVQGAVDAACLPEELL